MGLPKETPGYTLKKQKCTGKLENDKRPILRSLVDDLKIICIVKKKQKKQAKNTLQDESVHVSLTMIKRRLHAHNLRGFTTRCKTLLSLKNRKASSSSQNTEKMKPVELWNKDLWTDEIKINLYQRESVTWSQSDWAALQLLKARLKAERPHKKTWSESGCSEGLGEHL